MKGGEAAAHPPVRGTLERTDQTCPTSAPSAPFHLKSCNCSFDLRRFSLSTVTINGHGAQSDNKSEGWWEQTKRGV